MNSRTPEKKNLLCDMCVDIIEDIDEFITSDTTLDEIVNYVEGVSSNIKNSSNYNVS